MAKRVSLVDYLSGFETNRPMELAYGFVREPPAPFYGHQTIVTRIGGLLDWHVRTHGLGTVCVAPVDVVLDARRDLVVQPDVIFVAAERQQIIQRQVWGPPDLVVEVLSAGTARRDRTVKLPWYRRHGVGECWLVDAAARRVEVFDCREEAGRRPRLFSGRRRLQSRVLPTFSSPAGEFFA